MNDAPRILGNELITNGDFTTNLSGWTSSGSVAASSGRANFGISNAVGPHSISQTISTIAGQTYQLSFDYLDGSSTLNQSLVATVNGIANLLTTADIVTDVATTAPGARYTFTFVADSSSTTITLTDTSDNPDSPAVQRMSMGWSITFRFASLLASWERSTTQRMLVRWRSTRTSIFPISTAPILLVPQSRSRRVLAPVKIY